MPRKRIFGGANVSVAVRISSDLHNEILEYLEEMNKVNPDMDITEAQVMRSILRRGLNVSKADLIKSRPKLKAVDNE